MAFKMCVVPSCNNDNKNHAEKTFLTIPKNAERRRRWAEAIGVAYLPFDGKYCVCENHFNLPEDTTNWLFYCMIGTDKLMLKPDVVPHQFISTPPQNDVGNQVLEGKRLYTNAYDETVSCSKKIKIVEQLADKENLPDADSILGDSKLSAPLVKKTSRSVCVQANLRKPHRSVKINTGPPQMQSCGTSTKISMIDKSYGTEINQQHLSSSSEGNSQSSCSEYLPISSGSGESVEEKVICEEIRRKSTVELIEKKSRFYLGVPPQVYCLVRVLSEWTKIYYVDVLITLKKIRQGDTHSRLADDFGCSTGNISRIFYNSVQKISGVLQNFIFCPEADAVKRLLPIPFRYRYNKIYSIIDCLEIEIEKPSDSLMQSLTWSEYKKCNTVKFLLSCTPNGFINFVSGAYGGRISDTNITRESEYLKYIPSKVQVMAERGFKQVETLFSEKQCELVRPPSVSGVKKSTREEVHQAKRIAALRIHVERVIRRVREFEMLHGHFQLSLQMLPVINHIMIISCGLINLQDPLIK